MTSAEANQHADTIQYFRFPPSERKDYDRNYLVTVAIELRYPTYLRLKETEPTEISEALRERFPRYERGSQMEMTPLGTTDPQPVYKFATRQNDPVVDISASNMVLVAKRYKSFEEFSSYVSFLIDNCVSHLATTFFTRVGLRYINNVSGFDETGSDILEWINNDLVKPVAGGEIGTVSNMTGELTGPLEGIGNYTFRYGLSPPSQEARRFVLDWDYYKEDVEVEHCMELLQNFHDAHFPFFWWALGKNAKEALENGTSR